jgi:hypothetical protein
MVEETATADELKRTYIAGVSGQASTEMMLANLKKRYDGINDQLKQNAARARQCLNRFTQIAIAGHLRYSSDLIPSDFFLLEHVKNRLQRIVFPSYRELLAGISQVPDRIPTETLQHLFEH